MIVISSTITGFSIKYTLNNMNDNIPLSYFSTVKAFFSISLAVNALTSALIVYKIITIYKEIQDLNVQTNRNGNPNIFAAISILIEAGLIAFVGQLAQIIVCQFADDAFPLVTGSLVMLYVRASCRLLSYRRVFIYLFYYTGNFDDSCVCASRDGHFLR